MSLVIVLKAKSNSIQEEDKCVHSETYVIGFSLRSIEDEKFHSLVALCAKFCPIYDAHAFVLHYTKGFSFYLLVDETMKMRETR